MKALVEKYFNNKKILILGFGREGQESLKLVKKFLPDSKITIADKNENIKLSDNIFKDFTNIDLKLGDGYTSNLNDFDIIVKSPGIPELLLINVDKSKITSQTDLFLQKYSNQIIGVTGTKGKSTTSTLIHHILKNFGYKTLLLGNIGIPSFSVIDDIDKDTILVMELSAHQLNYIHNAPRVSILLNIFPEHLDHFNSFEDYYFAKYNIFKYQNNNDISIIESPCPNLNSLLKDLHTKQIYIDDVYIQKKDIFLANQNYLTLKGEHNYKNICASLIAVNSFIEKEIVNFNDIFKILKNFNPLPHRLEYVGNFQGIDFYNDSISTIPQSAIAAVETLKNVDTIILGGFDRGINYDDLVDHLLYNSNIHNILLIGKAGNRIFELFNKKKRTASKIIEKNIINNLDLKQAVDFAFQNTAKNKICLLSPAASSYDCFKNFEERGEVYKQLIKNFSE